MWANNQVPEEIACAQVHFDSRYEDQSLPEMLASLRSAV
jgi:hypothetical protein